MPPTTSSELFRSDVGLLVGAQDHRTLGRVQVKPDDVDDHVDELWVGGQLEGVRAVRLALVDGAGQVVGVNKAYLPPQSGAVSLSFAISAATVVNVTDQPLTTGKAVRPCLGVVADRMTPEMAVSP